MDNDTKRAVACALFGAAMLGALATSFLHVAEFFGPITPEWFPRMRYVSALSLDVLAAGCGFGLIIIPAGRVRGRWILRVGLAGTVGLSVWANWLYALAHAPAGASVALAIVSAALPVLALIVPHALAVVLAAVPADGPTGSVEARIDQPAGGVDHAAARRIVQTTGRLPAGYSSGAELARAIGVNPAQVSRWMQAGRAGGAS